MLIESINFSNSPNSHIVDTISSSDRKSDLYYGVKKHCFLLRSTPLWLVRLPKQLVQNLILALPPMGLARQLKTFSMFLNGT